MFIPGCTCCGTTVDTSGICGCPKCTQPPSEITIEVIPGTPVPGPTLPMIRNTGSTTFSYNYDTQSNQKMEWSTAFTAPGWGLAAGSTTWSLGGLLWRATPVADSFRSNLSADGFYETRTMTIPWSMDSGGVMDAAAIAVATDFLAVKRVLAHDGSFHNWPINLGEEPITIGEPQWGYSNYFANATSADLTISCTQLTGNLAYSAYDLAFYNAYMGQQYSIGISNANLLYQQKLYIPTQKITSVLPYATEPETLEVPLYPIGMKNLMGCAPAVTGAIPTVSGFRVYVTYTRWTLAQYRVDIKTTPSPSPRHPYGILVGTPYRLPPAIGHLSGEAPNIATPGNAVFGTRVFGGSPPTYGPSSPLETYSAGNVRYKQDYFQAWVEYYKASRDAFVDAGNWDKYYVYTEIFPDTQLGYVDFPDASFKVTAGRAEGAATPTSGRCGCVPVLPDTVDVTLSATGLTQIDGPTISIPQSFIDALNKTITMTRRTDYVDNAIYYGRDDDTVAFYSVGPIDGPSYPTATSDCPWDGTYWATLEIKCDSARIHVGLHTPYANEFSNTPGAADIESEGYYLGGVDFGGAIGASINAICSGASTTFEFAPVGATVFAVNWDSPGPPGYEFADFSVSGVNTVVTFPPLWKPNAAWTAAAFSGGGTAPSHFVKASLVIAGYTGVRPAITARRAGVFHITATNVHYDYWFRCYRNATQVIEYGSDDTPDEGGDTGSITRTFNISVGDVITLGDPDDYNVCTNLQIWWTAT